jgi:preprotein translocase subunit SecG
MSAILMTLLLITAVFLILLVLVQRGKGGGLAGAFGGMGGQSAFGTKAGDLFTKVTIVVATIWILLCLATVWTMTGTPGRLEGGGPIAPAEAPADGQPLATDEAPADNGAAADTPATGEGTAPADTGNAADPDGSDDNS